MSDYQQDVNEESAWLTVSDLMAGLMMVFLFIAIVLMRQAIVDKEKYESIAEIYFETKQEIAKQIQQEFEDDLQRWYATIDEKSLTLFFTPPETMFENGRAEIANEYQAVLADFFPRYLNILKTGYFVKTDGSRINFSDIISEVRIEGHTSSVWRGAESQQDAYFRNMKLSQDRTRTVLSYVSNLEAVQPNATWVQDKIAAVGLSSSKLRYIEFECNDTSSEVNKASCTEDVEASQRVSFRIITNADSQIETIFGAQ